MVTLEEHYHIITKYDDSSEARGFVENSFISGQTPKNIFMLWVEEKV